MDKCYLCGGTDYDTIHEGVRENPNINVLKCKRCGLVQLSKFIKNVDEFYHESGMWNYETPNLDKLRNETHDDDYRRFLFTRNKILNKVVCDFGCGAGGYLMEAAEIASEVYGIELEYVMRNSLNGGGVKCFPSLDVAEKELAGKVDVLTLWHVFEHLEDPIGILRRLKKLLTPEGVIYIEVPNANDALLSLYTCEAFADFTYWECHLFLFNNETLKQIIERAGMKVNFQTQVQRYPLANHLYWLTHGKPGGHMKWNFLNRNAMDREYEQMLISIGKADTLVAEITVS